MVFLVEEHMTVESLQAEIVKTKAADKSEVIMDVVVHESIRTGQVNCRLTDEILARFCSDLCCCKCH